MIRILLVDDQNIVRQGIQAMLEPRPKLKVVGTAEDGNSAMEQISTLMPDIVLMDIEMSGMSGITATQQISQQFPKTKVIVLSSHENPEYVKQALQAGAEGYLQKNTLDALAEDLERAIWSVYRGHSHIESKLLKQVYAEPVVPFSPSIILDNKNEFTSVEKPSLQETSFELHNDANRLFDNNNKHSPKNGESFKINPNGSPSKIGKTTLKSFPEQTKFQIEKPPDRSKGTLDFNKSSNGQAIKKPFVQQDSIEREQKPQPKKRISLKLLKWWIGVLVVVPILLIMTITLIRFLNSPKPQPGSASVPVRAEPPKIKKVAALGRIEPQGEVMSLSGPTSLDSVQVEQLLVQVGDRVKKGQLITILDGRKRQQAALDEARVRSKTVGNCPGRSLIGTRAFEEIEI